MILNIKAPNNIDRVRYGQIEMLVSEDGTIDVPAYVAKTLAGSGFIVSPASDIASTILQLIAAGDPFEANYLFQAYGKPIPQDKTGPVLDGQGQPTGETQVTEAADPRGDAAALFAAKGEPVVTLV